MFRGRERVKLEEKLFTYKDFIDDDRLYEFIMGRAKNLGFSGRAQIELYFDEFCYGLHIGGNMHEVNRELVWTVQRGMPDEPEYVGWDLKEYDPVVDKWIDIDYYV